MRNPLVVILAVLFMAASAGCTLVKVNMVPEVEPLEERTLSGSGPDKILLLDLSGFISSAREDGSFPGSAKRPGLLARMREALDRARKDRSVKAVVLRVNSPGGTVTAADILYHELSRFKQETGAKIVAHIMDLGTSGAYYAALAADRITAQPTSVTGSIGVIMYRLDASGLLQKIGIQGVEIASGAHKGMGSPLRPATSEEIALFRSIIDSMQARFVDTVAESRGLAPDAARKLADGRIYSSKEAQAAGLIDGIGYLEDAVALARQLAKLERASVVTYYRPGEYRANFYAMNLVNIDMSALAEPGAHFLYVWWP